MDLKIRIANHDDFNGIYKLLEQLWPDLKLDFDNLLRV